MQFSDLQARAQLLASLEGWSDVSPAPTWSTLVNEAWYQFSWDGECIIGTQNITTVVGQAAYTLTGVWKKVIDVVYDTAGANTGILRSDEDYERWANPTWRAQANAPSSRYTFAPFSTITLIPPPSAIVTVSVRGLVQGTALVNSTDVPPVPDPLQEAICIYAAYLQGKVYMVGDASTRMETMLKDYQQYVADAVKYANFETEVS